MSLKDTIRLSGTINPEKEPELAKATTELLKIYVMSDLSKEGIRCLARREGLLTSEKAEAAL